MNELNKIDSNNNNTGTKTSEPENKLLSQVDFTKLPSFYTDDEKYNLYFSSRIDSTMDLIVPRLYISDDIAARNKKLLNEKKITHILNITTNIPNKYEPEITYKKLIILDFESQNISQYFNEAYEFIDNALADEKNSLLVHCNAGISRSSSFVIAYLMKKRIFKNYKDALSHVRKCRPIVSPNKGFEKQLISLESKIKKRNACLVM